MSLSLGKVEKSTKKTNGTAYAVNNQNIGLIRTTLLTLVQLNLLDLCYPHFQATFIHVFNGFENKDKRIAIS